jgi:hypothetical protein
MPEVPVLPVVPITPVVATVPAVSPPIIEVILVDDTYACVGALSLLLWLGGYLVKTLAKHILMVSIVVAVCQMGLVLAVDYPGLSSYSNGVIAPDENDTVPLAPLPTSFQDSQPAEQAQPNCRCQECSCCCVAQPCAVWTIDYRVRWYFDTHTSYQFGTAPGDPAGPYAPLSKLDFELDSTWHGFQIALQKPNYGIHFEWLTPMEQDIDGVMADYDWNIFVPRNDPSRLDSLTHSSQRWNEGQVLDLGGEFRYANYILNLPIEVWPGGGFRFQRFNTTATSINYLVPPLGPQPLYDGVDVITFNQQYYLLYLGGQLRTDVSVLGVPIDVVFEGDWAYAWGYNIDHHLLRDDFIPGVFDRYTKESTDGDAMHLALSGETPISRRWSVGLQIEHQAIDTTGTHHYQQASGGVNLSWTNGVKVRSDQTALTAFLRGSF